MSDTPLPPSSPRASDASSQVVLPATELMDLPPELHLEIFTHCADHRSAVNLRLTSRYFDAVYRRHEDRILTDIAKRLVAPFREFYECLEQLGLLTERLLHPPPEGWPSITLEACWGDQAEPAEGDQQGKEKDQKQQPAIKDFDKTRFAITVLKHLSYVKEDFDETAIWFFSSCIVYSDFDPEDFDRYGSLADWNDAWQGETMGGSPIMEIRDITPLNHVVAIVDAYDYGGTMVLLDTWTGRVYEYPDDIGPRDCGSLAADWCRGKIEEWTSLRQVFLPGGEVIEGPLPERYDAEALEARGEPVRATDDGSKHAALLEWVRHLHWKHGWPGEAWDKEKCLEELEDFYDRWGPWF